MPTESTSSSPLGHATRVAPRIGPNPTPLPPTVMSVYRSVSSSAVSDQVGRLWTMDSGIKPLNPAMPRLAGIAITVKAPPGDNWAVYGGLSRAFPSSVLIIDWRGHTESCAGGEKVLLPALQRGLAGIVVDGAWRDIDEVTTREFPILGRSTSPYSPAKRDLGEINVPVSCGGVVVEPGDVVVGDANGVAVVPRRCAEEIAWALADGMADSGANDEAMVSSIEKLFESAIAARHSEHKC